MINAEYDEKERVTYLRVPLDDATFAWVAEIAEACHNDPALVISAILRDVREDDETAHLCASLGGDGAVTLN